MKPLLILALAAVIFLGLYWASRSTPRLTTLSVGDTVPDLPDALAGPCVQVVVTHGACGLCELTLSMAPDATTWLTMEPHARDDIYPRLLVSEDAWDALGVQGIPTEFLLHYGRVLYTGGFTHRDTLPTCPPLALADTSHGEM